MGYFEIRRKSYAEVGKLYFWTATIHSWRHLLSQDIRKEIVVSSLAYLSKKSLITVFGFVIMPNHVHFIWRMNALNGKETSFGSFLKFTAHEFKKSLGVGELANYSVIAANKYYEFWQKDPLAVELYSPELAYQKLDYIHNNPLSKGWNLSQEPTSYKYSSASFYEFGDRTFSFLQHIGNEF